MEEYLTTKELAKRIKMHPGTIRNLVWKKELIENVHFVRPTPGKVLYMWSAIEAWMFKRSPKAASKDPQDAKGQVPPRLIKG